MNKELLIIPLLFFIPFPITYSQVGIMLFENNITLFNFETYSKLKVYGSNRSVVELAYREIGINEILSSNLHYLIQNLSEQKNFVKLEFFQKIIDFKAENNERIVSKDLLFLIKRDKNAEPGFRVFFISAKELKEFKADKDYSVAIVPLVEMPLIVYVDGVAIRKIDIIDIETVYEDKPKISVILKNSGTVTTSFKLNLNVSDKIFYVFDIIKPKEIKIIKFPIELFGKFNVSVTVDYYSHFSFFEKEIEIKEVLPLTEKIETFLTNLLPFLIICFSIIISILIIKRRK